MTDDNELIITNEQTEDAPKAPAAEPRSAGAPPAEEAQTFREALHEIHEQDAPLPSGRLTVMRILGGDFFMAQILRRQVLLLMLVGVFAIVYVANRYSVQKSMIEIDKLKKELQEAKFKALATTSRLTEQSRQSRVLDMLKANRDSVLHIADQPPYIIKVEE